MLTRKTYNKLIRDRIPEVIRSHGKLPNYRELNREDYREALKEKLLEEAIELKKAESMEDMINEISDVMEILDAVIEEFGINRDEVIIKKLSKKEERGAFTKKLFLEYVDEGAGIISIVFMGNLRLRSRCFWNLSIAHPCKDGREWTSMVFMILIFRDGSAAGLSTPWGCSACYDVTGPGWKSKLPD
ncbi:MAG TPA: nucleoside triphosphate pyrophosphohydrolase [Candidatus Gracilibacteria bacterium]|nr:nucleoside triphosphate pyrophosphohydrolase [Candidatus Gracilibacteria bacterium]